MDTLTTNGLIAFCDPIDIDIIAYITEKKLTGRKFAVMVETDFPENVRIEARILRQTIEAAAIRCNENHLMSNIHFEVRDTLSEPYVHDSVFETTSKYYSNANLPIYAQLQPPEKSTDSQISSAISEEHNDDATLQTTALTDSSILISSGQQNDDQQKKRTFNQDQDQDDENLSQQQPTQRSRRRRRKQQPNPNWPDKFEFPHNKLSDKLRDRLANVNKNLKPEILQKHIIKALFLKIKDDLNM